MRKKLRTSFRTKNKISRNKKCMEVDKRLITKKGYRKEGW